MCNFSEELKNCKVSLPKTIPANGEVIAGANIELPEQKLLHSVGICGVITGRKGNKITGYDLRSVSFIGSQP